MAPTGKNVILKNSNNENIFPYNGCVKTVNGQAPDDSGNVTVSGGGNVDLSGRVATTGNRGSLAGYETSGSSTTINGSSPDSNEAGSPITVENGTVGTSWTKVVRITAPVTATLGSNWVWQGGKIPTIVAGGILVLCWCGSGGLANFASPS